VQRGAEAAGLEALETGDGRAAGRGHLILQRGGVPAGLAASRGRPLRTPASLSASSSTNT
jgi:hypothetical protein